MRDWPVTLVATLASRTDGSLSSSSSSGVLGCESGTLLGVGLGSRLGSRWLLAGDSLGCAMGLARVASRGTIFLFEILKGVDSSFESRCPRKSSSSKSDEESFPTICNILGCLGRGRKALSIDASIPGVETLEFTFPGR